MLVKRVVKLKLLMISWEEILVGLICLKNLELFILVNLLFNNQIIYSLMIINLKKIQIIMKIKGPKTTFYNQRRLLMKLYKILYKIKLIPLQHLIMWMENLIIQVKMMMMNKMNNKIKIPLLITKTSKKIKILIPIMNNNLIILCKMINKPLLN